MASRDHFASVMFLTVVGIIALAFIGYLAVDYTRTLILSRKIKRRHRHDREQHGRV